MKVINRNEIKKAGYPKRIVCDHCGAELEYNKEDEYNGLDRKSTRLNSSHTS